jgi:hypothetical protein
MQADKEDLREMHALELQSIVSSLPADLQLIYALLKVFSISF